MFNNNNNWGDGGAHQGDRGDGTEGGEGREEVGEEILAGRPADQPKVVQEVLADLKTFEWCLPDSKKCDSLGEIFEY